uniref:Uncharacterized protein n=1 Tax=viral metagenome TaxID=1070528 RepID=A0A6C0DZH4_9ZZZZ
MSDELMDDNLDDIVEKIFSKPPKERCSIHLELEEETAEIAQDESVERFIFNILFLITYKGIKKLYGKDKEMINLKESEIMVIKEYVRSYGYELVVRGNNTDRDPWEIIKSGERLINYQVHFDKIY